MKILFKQVAAVLVCVGLTCTFMPCTALAATDASDADAILMSTTDSEQDSSTTADATDETLTSTNATTTEAETSYSGTIKYKVKNSTGWSVGKSGSVAGSGTKKAYGVRVYKPTITETITTTTTQTTTYSDGTSSSTEESSEKQGTEMGSYGITLKVGVADSGVSEAVWNSSKTYRTFFTDDNKIMQFVRIAGTNLPSGCHIYYRVYVKNFGWLGWARDGQKAGTKGNSASICRLKIKIASKAPGKTINHFYGHPTISYKADTNEEGWGAWVKEGETAGVAKNKGKLERLKLTLSIDGYTETTDDVQNSDGLLYRVRSSVKDTKASAEWSEWKSSAQSAGVDGTTMYAFQIKLSDNLKTKFDVYYRVFLKRDGWLQWAKNGQKAGSAGYKDATIGALQVVITLKNKDVPGALYTHYIDFQKVLTRANNNTSRRNWMILVDRYLHEVFWLRRASKKKPWHFVRYSPCDIGKATQIAWETKKGTYEVNYRYKSKTHYGYTMWYIIVLKSANHAFHSILYQPHSKKKIYDSRMRGNYSLGCIRLPLKTIKWMYNNVRKYSRIVIYGDMTS